jgi:hypothetical protein
LDGAERNIIREEGADDAQHRRDGDGFSFQPAGGKSEKQAIGS